MSLSHNSSLAYITAGATAIALFSLIFSARKSQTRSNYPTSTRSPLHDVPRDSTQRLPYPPDALIPGARDVPTPYGSIRVYEFGPPTSEHKVLFLHGISTPSISLVGVAESLAFKRGCRVMLVDLFGRGWSDGVPDLPYDGRLYASQILMTLASSKLGWTEAESGGFALVGYSLGGCIAADFTSWFPELVKDLVLIAPAGLQRESNITWQTRLIYSGWLPESWAQAAVRRRLRAAPMMRGKQKASSASPNITSLPTEEAEAATSAELPEDAIISTSRGEVDIESAVDWQMQNHEGFMPAFMSSIRHAPIRGQQHRWSLIGARLDKQRELLKSQDVKTANEEAQRIIDQGLKSGRVLLILGGKDAIVKPSEVSPDAKAALGDENVVERVYEQAGHDVALVCRDEIADEIWQQWQQRQGA